MTRPCLCLLLTFCFTATAILAGCQPAGESQKAEGGENEEAATAPARLEVDESLAQRLPGQGHAMTDVEYHFSNLWFAGQAENWELAEFYLHETEEGIEWAVNIRPVRPDAAGEDVDLEEILQSIENTTLKDLHMAIEAEDAAAFETGYEQMMQACLSCHVACDKPYLRPRIPEQPPAAGIEFEPAP